jgi:Fic family protein
MKTPNYIIWLQSILTGTRSTQTKLAKELGVTHATLHRWLNGKNTPHPKTLEELEKRYLEIAVYNKLEKSFPFTEWQQKFLNIQKNAPSLSDFLRKDNLEDFLIKSTYHTNAIEGSTLSLHETQSVLFNDQVIPGHPLREHLEVTNHKLAFEKTLQAALDQQTLDLKFVLSLHETLMKSILNNAGQLRTHPVRIAGARVVPCNPIKVHEKLNALLQEMEATKNPTGFIIQHAEFEAIHPFSDGNGRIGRLLLNFQLLKANYPPAILRQDNKHLYYQALETAQVQEEYAKLMEYMYIELCENISKT